MRAKCDTGDCLTAIASSNNFICVSSFFFEITILGGSTLSPGRLILLKNQCTLLGKSTFEIIFRTHDIVFYKRSSNGETSALRADLTSRNCQTQLGSMGLSLLNKGVKPKKKIPGKGFCTK